MNSYMENLKSTTVATLSALAAEQDALVSEQTAERYKLYYAQGALLTALDKVGQTGTVLGVIGAINTECLDNDNTIVNLLGTATAAGANVVTSNANMATAASNVQIASNAIVQLASEIGAALNNANATLFGHNAYTKLLDANSLINEVANDAKRLSEQAMTASSDTSEIIATAVLAQANVSKGKIDGLLKAVQAELGKYNGLYVAEQAAVGAASIAERQAEGAVDDAVVEATAIAQGYAGANGQLNLSLVANLTSADLTAAVPTCTVDLSFDELLAPTFKATPASGVGIPQIAATYYAVLVSQAQQQSVTGDLLQQLFSVWNGATLDKDPDALKKKQGLNKQFQPVNAASSDKAQTVTFDQDVYQQDLVVGTPYVVFIYAVLSNEYKFFINDYADRLSAPSLSFNVAATLPTATNIQAQLPRQFDADNPLSVTFDVSPFKLTGGGQLDYRCILVKEDLDNPQHLAGATLRLKRGEAAKSPIYFDLDIAQQVPSANYEVGSPVTTPAADTQPVPAPAPYIAQFTSCSTDNFGNMLRAGATYRPYVIAAVPDQNPNTYVAELVWGDPVQLLSAPTTN